MGDQAWELGFQVEVDSGALGILLNTGTVAPKRSIRSSCMGDLGEMFHWCLLRLSTSRQLLMRPTFLESLLPYDDDILPSMGEPGMTQWTAAWVEYVGHFLKHHMAIKHNLSCM
jgi:hypothetical protein